MYTKVKNHLFGKFQIITLGVLLIVFTALVPSIFKGSPTDFSNWETYSNARFGFSIQYPPELSMYSTIVSHENFEEGEEAMVLYIGPRDYLDTVQNIRETEGPADYLVVTADVSVDSTDSLGCLDGSANGRVSIDEIETDLCLRPSISSEESLWISTTKDEKTFFSFRSDQYEGKEKTNIDKIISTFRFTK